MENERRNTCYTTTLPNPPSPKHSDKLVLCSLWVECEKTKKSVLLLRSPVASVSQVAVKVIDKRKAKKDSYVTKNLRREGHIQQMIRHPNITQLLDILETENSYYLVMELCPGGNLMNRIYDKKRLDERETQKYIRQLVLAVEHLHRAGVVHRYTKYKLALV